MYKVNTCDVRGLACGERDLFSVIAERRKLMIVDMNEEDERVGEDMRFGQEGFVDGI